MTFQELKQKELKVVVELDSYNSLYTTYNIMLIDKVSDNVLAQESVTLDVLDDLVNDFWYSLTIDDLVVDINIFCDTDTKELQCDLYRIDENDDTDYSDFIKVEIYTI